MAEANVPRIVIGLLVLLFSLTVHEMAHAWSADRLGDPTARQLGRISFNPLVHLDLFGSVLLPMMALMVGAPILGWAKPVPVRIDRLRRGRADFLWVAAAGPLSNVALALAAALLFRLVAPAAMDAAHVWWMPLMLFLLLSIQVNLILAVFNMLPIPPLDGGNVLGCLLPERAAWQFDRLRPYGIFVLFGLLYLGVIHQILQPVAILMRLLTP
ncbi:MAG: site-2 protease family protein [Luteitalea sp.]|nr:site-2 protease family protein [Luteitalea sp.]